MDNPSIIPNTTQVPHLIIREWMPLLGDVELRVLLVVADQTLGWIEDPETKRRKEKDWISQGLLMRKINRSDRAIQNALKRLVDTLRIVQAHDEQGELLDSPQKRMKCGGKIFYRLSLTSPQQPTPEESSGAEAPALFDAEPPKNLRAKNLRATKETTRTQLKSCRTSELASSEKKEANPTRFFFWKFDQLSRAIRNKKPTFVKHKDGQLIVHALGHLTEFQLELELIWFLQNKPTMRPCLGAALCKEVIGDFIKASRREHGIYICQKCRREITSRFVNDHGWWEARYPGEEISGYWISQMICPWRSAADLLKEEADAESQQYFYNFVLGQPYISADQRIPQGLFLRNIASGPAETSGWNVMGADTGDENHIVIGNEHGVFWIGKLKDRPNKTRWEYMAELIQFYDIRVCVIDGMPWTEEALRLARKFPYRVYLNFYKDDPKMLEVVRWNDEKEGDDKTFEDEVKVHTSRNRIMDDTISSLHRGETKFAMQPDDPTFRMLIAHAQTMYARTVTNQHGQEKREWESTTGVDHAWHALLYWSIAMRKRLKYEPNK